jgi:hypothetical protein
MQLTVQPCNGICGAAAACEIDVGAASGVFNDVGLTDIGGVGISVVNVADAVRMVRIVEVVTLADVVKIQGHVISNENGNATDMANKTAN